MLFGQWVAEGAEQTAEFAPAMERFFQTLRVGINAPSGKPTLFKLGKEAEVVEDVRGSVLELKRLYEETKKSVRGQVGKRMESPFLASEDGTPLVVTIQTMADADHLAWFKASKALSGDVLEEKARVHAYAAQHALTLASGAIVGYGYDDVKSVNPRMGWSPSGRWYRVFRAFEYGGKYYVAMFTLKHRGGGDTLGLYEVNDLDIYEGPITDGLSRGAIPSGPELPVGSRPSTANIIASSVVDRNDPSRDTPPKMLPGSRVEAFDPQAIAKALDEEVERLRMMNTYFIGGQSYHHPMTEKDYDYLFSLDSGRDADARKIVEEAAEQGGYTIDALHGTDAFGFTVFSPSISDFGQLFFAKDLATSGSYASNPNVRPASDAAGTGKSLEALGMSGVYRVVLRMDNPLVVDAKGRKWNSIHFLGNVYTTRGLSEYAKKNGHDGVIFNNLVDYGGRNHDGVDRSKAGTVYVVFDSRQVKSLDLVVRDDDGKIVPPPRLGSTLLSPTFGSGLVARPRTRTFGSGWPLRRRPARLWRARWSGSPGRSGASARRWRGTAAAVSSSGRRRASSTRRRRSSDGTAV